MNARRDILAVGGTVVGIVGGLVAAAGGPPVAGMLAALGAFVAGGATFLPSTLFESESMAATLPDLLRPVHRPSQATVAPAASADDVRAPTTVPPHAEAPAASSSDAPTGGEQRPSTPMAPPADRGGSDVPLLTDPTTGLFSEEYFEIAIEARLAAARRHLRPVSVVLLEVVEGLRIDRVRPTDPHRVAEAVKATLREADTASRRADGRFALLLEDTPENGAIWTVERIRRRLVDADAGLTVWAGVACYPAHAFDKASILAAADHALDAAREWHQDRIEVAIGD